jgi:outer membrane murein-binding lipoprotein Lpp
MSTSLIASLVLVCLVAAVLLGQAASRRLAQHHLTPETRDTVKLSLGLVATMSALLLGLLVSSAKGTYDRQGEQVNELAAKVATLDRVLALYGPETAAARRELRAIVENAIARAWPENGTGSSDLRADFRSGDEIYNAVQQLAPAGPTQSDLKNRAANLTLDLAETRALLAIVVTWLVMILFGFSLLAPKNAVATAALLAAAAAVSGALLLLLEYYGPFEGLIRIASDPMRAALGQAPN